MANYCTAAEVKVILTNIDLASITTNYLTMADSIINAKLARQYTLPFSTTPPVINTIATILAAYYVTEAQFSGGQANKSEWVNNKYSQMMKLLDQLAEGKMDLVATAGTVIDRTNTDEVSSNTSGYAPTFGEDDEINQAVDSDKLDDISNDRD